MFLPTRYKRNPVSLAMVEKHLSLIEKAASDGVQILCTQEIFNGPYFCPSQDPAWYDFAETVPGPSTEMMQELAKKHDMAIVERAIDDFRPFDLRIIGCRQAVSALKYNAAFAAEKALQLCYSYNSGQYRIDVVFLPH